MILQSLVSHYEALAAKGQIARPGWAQVKVSWALNINEAGELISVLPLKEQSADGKKMVPRIMELPLQFKRSGSKAPPFFLCDNLQYCLGIDKGQVTEKSRRCFELFRDYHRDVLMDVDDSFARAIINFTINWIPENTMTHSAVSANNAFISEGGNITFFLSERNQYVHQSQKIIAKWDDIQNRNTQDITSICMVTGSKTSIARIHNSVKGIRASSLSPNGWTLVGFDKEAFESYGKTQSYNAPVGKYAAFAYTTALNHLLADRQHVKQIGDTTVVFWAEDAVTQSQDIFAAILDGSGDIMTDKDLNDIMTVLSRGEAVDWDGIQLSPENRFYVLGIAPNAARLSVRFYFTDSFGNIVRHIKSHYERLEIVTDNRSKWKNIPLWALLGETVNQKSKDKSPSPQMSGDVLRAILTGGRYPATLYNQVMLRIRAEHEITRGRAAIIKAYLLRNTDENSIKEVLTVSLNEKSEHVPYVLGRLFSVLEGIQQAANPGINTTIKDRFFNSACATPAAVFPIIMKLSNSHLRKLEGGMLIYWSKQLSELAQKLDGFPQSLALNEQGAFILGYYHQTQKRFEKREDK